MEEIHRMMIMTHLHVDHLATDSMIIVIAYPGKGYPKCIAGKSLT